MPRTISFDRVADVYDATRGISSEAEQPVVDALAETVGAGRLLEVGVGTGRWARPLRARGLNVIGTDVSRRMLQVGRSNGLAGVLLADVRRLPFRDRSFGSSMSNHLLHLVEDWPNALREIARVTAGSYRSILEYETARPDLSAEYKALARAQGHPVGPPGLPERELRERLPPDHERPIASVKGINPVEEILGPLERRAFRDTWAIPEPDHRQIIGTLRSRHAAAEVRTELSVVLAEWDPRRLASFAEAAAANGPRRGGADP